MATKPTAALRLGMEGKEKIEQGLGEIGAAGERAARRAAAAFERAGEDITAATARQEQAAQRLAAFSPNVQMGSERAGPSTSLFQTYQRDQEQARRQAEALRNALDPLRVAQAAYDSEIVIANALLERNIITEEEHARAIAQSEQALERFRKEQVLGAANDNARRYALQNVGFQLQDFFVQVSGGTSALRAFSQQGPQLIGALAGMGAEGSRLAAIMGGGIGVALGVAIPLVGMLASSLFGSEDASKKAADGMEEFRKRQADIGNFIDATTGKLIEQNRTLVNNAILTRQAAIGQNQKTVLDQRDQAFDAARGIRRIAAVSTGSAMAPINSMVIDPDVQRAINASGQSIVLLDKNLQALGARRPDLRPAIAQVSDLAAAAVRAGQDNDKLGKEIAALQGHGEAGSKGMAAVIEREVAYSTATSATEKARARLNIVKAQGDAADKAGGAALVKYRADLTAAENALHSAEAAERSARDTRRTMTKETNEATRAHEALIASIKRLSVLDDPVGQFRERANSIWKEMVAGNVSADEAQAAGEEAARQMRESFDRKLEQLRKEHPPIADLDAPLISDDQLKDSIETSLQRLAAVMKPKLSELAPVIDSLKAKAVDFVDSFKPSNWKNWADAGKSAVKELEDALWRLAVVNPLKNMLGGEHQSTLGDLLGGVGKLFGGVGAGKSLVTSDMLKVGTIDTSSFAKIPGFASGTDNAPGGLAWVGENGRELVNLPRGAQVFPASTSRRMMEAANDRGGPTIHIDARGATDPAEVEAAVMRGIAAAAPRIALGGSQLAEANMDRKARRRMR